MAFCRFATAISKSLIARGAKSWIIHVDENELAYNARFKGDAEFGAKLLGAIDLAFFNLVIHVSELVLFMMSITARIVYHTYETIS
jgi:hypothetical protein